ncbi:PilZ domain-containing protein [Gynuella sunshinyii]|uniref:Uncharacterized protein n=1 Tax=Gynuella sunshinyii YC6258 TaxID=1445510 RepID=A0A0C5V0C0_9GAMM|nr:PilZ domain-containing protein [Gynuella sunshinyii]AJQ93015.1 hypothetical Protein YC6258_00965 [Gynuella sunshinyii YC6258]
MTTAENLNIVHESEAQRQYARVRMPVELEMIAAVQGKNNQFSMRRYKVQDISAGGFSIRCQPHEFANGRVFKGTLKINVDGFMLSLGVSFLVRSVQEQSGRTGFEFQELGPKEISALRYLITAYLSGDLVNTGDMLNTLSRENFTKARKNSVQKVSIGNKVKAIGGTLVIFMTGLGAAVFVAAQLYNTFYVTTSQAAELVAETYHINMPKDGMVKPLIDSESAVKRGQPIATFETPVLDFMNSELGGEIDSERLASLTGSSVKGTLMSPCDCILAKSYIADGQYLPKGAEVFEMSVENAQPYVSAQFAFADSDNLAPGDQVQVRIGGNRHVYDGVIRQISVRQANGMSEALIDAQIELQQVPGYEDIGRPVTVTKGALMPFLTVSQKTES